MNKELRYVDYSGDGIEFEEMPQGCVIRDMDRNTVVVVRSLEDAVALRDSLNKMIRFLTVEGSL